MCKDHAYIDMVVFPLALLELRVQFIRKEGHEMLIKRHELNHMFICTFSILLNFRKKSNREEFSMSENSVTASEADVHVYSPHYYSAFIQAALLSQPATLG